MNITIIGAGLFGQLIATGLKAAGHYCMILDSREQGAGSPPAACLMNPNWIGKDVMPVGMEFLRKHFMVRTTVLRQPMKHSVKEVTAYRIPPQEILGQNRVHDFKVTRPPEFDGEQWHVTGDLRIDELKSEYMSVRSDAVIVAAGIWSQKFVPKHELNLMQRGGSALLFDKMDVPPEAGQFIIPWAPYKQVVGFHRGDGFWVGDGTAKKFHSDEDMVASYRRCLDVAKTDPLVNRVAMPEQLFGWRPYVKEKPCFLNEVEPKLWVATGAAKHGTILGGWCASKLVQEFAKYAKP